MKAIFAIAFLMSLALVYSNTQADVECPDEETKNATLIPHPTNCNHYFACVGNVPVPMKCPDGLHFNPELHVCDWPSKAGCKSEG